MCASVAPGFSRLPQGALSKGTPGYFPDGPEGAGGQTTLHCCCRASHDLLPSGIDLEVLRAVHQALINRLKFRITYRPSAAPRRHPMSFIPSD